MNHQYCRICGMPAKTKIDYQGSDGDAQTGSVFVIANLSKLACGHFISDVATGPSSPEDRPEESESASAPPKKDDAP